jgi:magnesium transporter
VSVIDNAVYVRGRRSADPAGLAETFELLRDRRGLGWIGLYRPDAAEFVTVAEEFDLDARHVEEAVCAHPRPKTERRGDVLFTVLRTARYLADSERVEFGELQVFTGPDFVVTVRHAESPDLAQVRSRLERDPERLALGPEAVLHEVIAQVVDEYDPVVAGLEDDIDEIEDQLFAGDPAVSRRIYELSREVIRFQRATHPLLDVLAALEAGFEVHRVPPALQQRLTETHAQARRVADRAASFRALLQNALTTHATLVGQRQNEEMRRLTEASLAQNQETRTLTAASLAQNEEVKKISAWAGILFAPTLIGTVYGMNFEVMPELTWRWGYPLALVSMVLAGLAFHAAFKRRHWL